MPSQSRRNGRSVSRSSAALPVKRGRYNADRLAEKRVFNSERCALAHQLRGAEDFFNLRRADPVARGLDHLVSPADEVQVTLGVAAHRIAGEQIGAPTMD